MDSKETKVNRPKIIIVSGFYPIFKGGAEYQMRLIADELKSDYEIVFLYLGDVPGAAVGKTYFEYHDGYKVYFIQGPSKLDGLFLRYFYSRRLFKILQIEKPKFVYQRVYKFISFYFSVFQKELNFQHFIHVADLFTIDFKQSTLRDKINFRFFNKTKDNGSKFIVQTSEQKKVLNSYGIEPVLQIYNMHPTIELEIQQIAEEKYANPVKHIVWVANIKPIKQLEVFITLAEEFIESKNLVFDVIGDLQDIEYGEALKLRMNKLSNLNHYSDKDNSFVNQFILDYAFVVMNTSKSEGFSNVFIQSWLRGVPVISLNSNPDELFDKISEFGFFCGNSTVTLKESLSLLLDNRDYVRRSSVCYKKSKELFSFSNIVKINKLLSD
ncbi:glycosyltransferase family protein [Sphingobacterium lactis]|uniref:Glycosyltransferase involved in cell wall bisynthesis n=1 Tax=Sphingobacterium lactis TaxID=797291 RepID=A0A1H5VP01_9SPHI|nr:hypothetical protein [Sphingobacterium lactis]SEF89029.1 Glycosyltransferase involved in cell wall bisynthesis [Sphingobacterium lactis]